MARYYTPEEGMRLWNARAKRMYDQVPATFKQAAKYAHTASKLELQSRIYGRSGSPGARSGKTFREEKIRFTGAGSAEIYNMSASIWRGDKVNVASILHFGRRAMTVPTRHGKRYYAWMVNRGDPRPRGRGAHWEWMRLAREGRAIVARSVRAVRGYAWRDIAIRKAKPKIAHLLRADVARRVWLLRE